MHRRGTPFVITLASPVIDKETGYPTLFIYVNTRKKDSRSLPPLPFAFAVTFPLWHASAYTTRRRTRPCAVHRSLNGTRPLFSVEIYAKSLKHALLVSSGGAVATTAAEAKCSSRVAFFNAVPPRVLSRFLAKLRSITNGSLFLINRSD